MRKHAGINQRTGRLKKGYKYGKNGAIVKVAASKAGAAKRKPAKRKARSKAKAAPGSLMRKIGRAVKLK